MTAPAIGQQTETEEETVTLDEVVVTATLRERNVQDIPVAVTVLGGEQLVKSDIHELDGIARNTPGLAYGEFSPGQAILAIRGVGSADDGAGLDNSVGVFLDGVYIGRGAGTTFDMFDLERIEVLKGPQGTLFGRNTIGGAISIVTEKPSDDLTAKAGFTVGNHGILRGQALVSGPITENLSGKLIFNARYHAGYVNNTLLNERVQDERYLSVRTQLRYGDWLLSADFMDDNRNHAGRFPVVSGNFDYVGLLPQLGAGDPWTTATPTRGHTRRNAWGASLSGDFDLGFATLTNIFAYRGVHADWEMPSVGAPLGGGYDLAAGTFGSDVIDDVLEDIHTVSEELRLTDQLDGPFSYVAGLYYFYEDTVRPEQFRLDRNTRDAGQTIVGNEYTRTRNVTNSVALYGQASWTPIENFIVLTVGGRYTFDNKAYQATAVNCNPVARAGFDTFTGTGALTFCDMGSLGIIVQTFEVENNISWHNFSPMGSFQYEFSDDFMLYTTISTGFKSGGFAGSQGSRESATVPVNPESVVNYETGIRTDWFDDTLRFNLTYFHMIYTDLQVVRFGPVAGSDFGTFVTTNIGSAQIDGIEVDWSWRPTYQFSLTGNLAWLSTVGNGFQFEVLRGGMPVTVDASGKNLRQAPTVSANVTAEYIQPLPGGSELDFRLQYSHTGEQRGDYVNDDVKYDEVNALEARIAWTPVAGMWGFDQLEISLWGKNLTNQAYVSHAYVIGPGVIGIWGAPLTFGATITAAY